MIAALALAEMKGYSGLEELRAKHLQWLIDTRQEEKAAEIKEKSKDYLAALALYLKAGLPSHAARYVQHNTRYYKIFQSKLLHFKIIL